MTCPYISGYNFVFMYTSDKVTFEVHWSCLIISSGNKQQQQKNIQMHQQKTNKKKPRA